MAIRFVGGNTAGKAGHASNSSTIALDGGLTGGIASAVAAGDLVIAVFGTASSADRTLSITDGTDPYTLIATELWQTETFDTNLRVAYKFMGATPDTATTFGPTTNASDAGGMAVYVFRGVDPDTPLDVAAVTGQAPDTSRVVPPDIEPITAGAFVVVAGAAGHSGGVDTFTSSDLTDFLTVGANDSNDVTIGIGHDPGWTSGPTNYATWGHTQTDATNFSWCAITLALRPATTGEEAALTGVSATGAVGAFGVAVVIALSGVGGAGSVGSMGAQVEAPISGVSATAAVGSVSPSAGFNIALTGVSGTGSVGSVAASVAAGLSGVQGTGAVGSLSPTAGFNVALTGVQGEGSVGSLAASVAAALSGVEGDGAVGSLSPAVGFNATLTGVQGAGGVGNLAVSVTAALAGNAATGAAGTLGTSVGSAVGLTGVEASGAAGSVAALVASGLSGVQGTGVAGSMAASVALELSGVAGAGDVGALSPLDGTAVELTGVHGTGALGDLGATTDRMGRVAVGDAAANAINGQSAAANKISGSSAAANRISITDGPTTL